MNGVKVKLVVSDIIQKIQMLIGGVSAIIAALGFVTTVRHMKSEDIIGVLFFGVIGGLLIWRSIVRKKLNTLVKTYSTRLSFDSNGSIEALATSMNTPSNIVQNNLQKMIDKKFFTNAFIDLKTNCIVFPDNNIAVACKGCGAVNNIPKGKVVKCEYCGNVIKVGE